MRVRLLSTSQTFGKCIVRLDTLDHPFPSRQGVHFPDLPAEPVSQDLVRDIPLPPSRVSITSSFVLRLVLLSPESVPLPSRHLV